MTLRNIYDIKFKDKRTLINNDDHNRTTFLHLNLVMLMLCYNVLPFRLTEPMNTFYVYISCMSAKDFLNSK